MKIRSIAEERGIRALLHFTQTRNLAGIAQYGLLPRRELEKPMYTAYSSDRYRLDDDDDAVSVSISRVAERMFAAKRHKSGHVDWIVLLLAPEILWTLPCNFCWCNAASNEIRNHRGKRGGPWAFAQMFAGGDDARKGLTAELPTNLDAEVQVLATIPPKYILGVAVNSVATIESARQTLQGLFPEPPPVLLCDY